MEDDNQINEKELEDMILSMVEVINEPEKSNLNNLLEKKFNETASELRQDDKVYTLLKGTLNNKASINKDSGVAKLAKEFTLCAKADLDCAKMLLNSPYKSLLVYHLQQFFEKHIKSIALLSGATQIGDHDTTVVMEKMAEKFVDLLPKSFFGINKMNLDKRREIALWKKEQIFFALDQLNIIVENTKTFIAPFLSRLKEDKTLPIKIDISKADTGLANLGETLDIFILAYVTFPHESFTRYPDGYPNPKSYDSGEIGIANEEVINYLLEHAERIQNHLTE